MAAHLKAVVKGLLDLQAKGSPVDELRQAAAAGAMDILSLKESWRKLCAEAEELRASTAEANSNLDTSSLRLQNLLYENAYYDNEIKACRDFKPAFTDEELDLMPLEQLRQQADSKSVQEDLAAGDDHKIMLARLAHERRARQAAVERLDELKTRNNALAAAVAAKVKLLEALQMELKAVQAAAQPVATHLDVKQPSELAMQPGAARLPSPLYVLYSQVAAMQQAFDLSLRVGILGSVAEAQQLERDAASEELPADGRERPAKRAKLDVSNPVADPYQAHPLSVTLEVQEGSAKLLSVSFHYLPALRLVTAACDPPADNAVLASLFPHDSGLQVPFEATRQLQSGTFVYDASRPDRPYRWAQHLAGLDLLPSLALTDPTAASGAVRNGEDQLADYRQQHRVRNVLQALVDAKHAHEALNEQLRSIAQLTVPPPPPAGAAAGAGPKGGKPAPTQQPFSVISQWREITPAEQSRQQPPVQAQQQPASFAGASCGSSAAGEQARDGKLAAYDMEEGETLSLLARAKQSAGVHQHGLSASNEQEGELPDQEMADGEAGTSSAMRNTADTGEIQQGIALPLDQAAAGHLEPLKFWDPPARLFRTTIKHDVVELTATVHVYSGYPTWPPRITIDSIKVSRRLPSASSASRASTRPPTSEDVGSVNDTLAIEREVNVEALKRLSDEQRLWSLSLQLQRLLELVDLYHPVWQDPGASGAADASVPAVRQGKQQLLHI